MERLPSSGLPEYLRANDARLQRIQNPALWAQDRAYRETKNEPNKISALRGILLDSLENISANGFNCSYNGKNATLYGQGAYLAKTGNFTFACPSQNAAPNTDGTESMILARVVQLQQELKQLLLNLEILQQLKQELKQQLLNLEILQQLKQLKHQPRIYRTSPVLEMRLHQQQHQQQQQQEVQEKIQQLQQEIHDTLQEIKIKGKIQQLQQEIDFRRQQILQHQQQQQQAGAATRAPNGSVLTSKANAALHAAPASTGAAAGVRR
jgi:hypothetical protein